MQISIPPPGLQPFNAVDLQQPRTLVPSIVEIRGILIFKLPIVKDDKARLDFDCLEGSMHLLRVDVNEFEGIVL